jgi:hypothetical protein
MDKCVRGCAPLDSAEIKATKVCMEVDPIPGKAVGKLCR